MGISIKGLVVVLVAAFALAAVFWFENRDTVPANPLIEAEFKRESDCRAKAEQTCSVEDQTCATRAIADCVKLLSAQ